MTTVTEHAEKDTLRTETANDSGAGATPSSLRPVSIAISAADRSSKDSPTMDFSLMLIQASLPNSCPSGEELL